MNDHHLAADFMTEAAKGAPPVAVTASALAGIVDWNTWVLILTVLYLLLQIGWMGWRFIDKARGERGPE